MSWISRFLNEDDALLFRDRQHVACRASSGTLALVLVSAAGARTGGTLGNFCGAVEGADWTAKRREASGFVGTYQGGSYWVWRDRLGCQWAGRKVALLTHVLGTKKLRLARLGEFACRAVRPKPREHVLSMKPLAARGECWDRRPSYMARFEWRPTIPRR